MKWHVFEAWLLLVYFELVMRFRGLKQVREIVRRQKVRLVSDAHRSSSSALCHAIDLACIFYFRRVFCLQRSAATVLLLRRHGWEADMVIGSQVLPFKSHAWAEIKGAIVNDKPYMQDIYRVLDRC